MTTRLRTLELQRAYNQGRIDALRELAERWAREAQERDVRSRS